MFLLLVLVPLDSQEVLLGFKLQGTMKLVEVYVNYPEHPKFLKIEIDNNWHFLLLHSKHVINTWLQKACNQMVSGLRD